MNKDENLCRGCDWPTGGWFCRLCFILLMKEVGLDNGLIRRVYLEWPEHDKERK